MIEVENLFFGYTKEMFIKDISFAVKKGEILGFLGPSGAGKSTLQKILIGMLRSYRGSVTVNGTQVSRHDNSFYETIGIDFEFPTLYEKLTARQNLDFFASLYAKRGRSTPELLEAVGLLPDADKKVSAFSKGMKGRLNFIKSLVHDPSILFLDEPTSGLDPTNGLLMKQLILAEKERGKTIILTTHNMQDAQELCDRVAFIVEGRLKALDTPHNLIMKKSAAKLVYTYAENGTEKSGECGIDATAADGLLSSLIARNGILTIHSKEQTLGDVFMDITGRQLS
ncbi:Fluoroquinolones export ATP-binding protein [bioreactor metagenome]|uniref:Fluoroquinolones export ATP-binding protein n=1 Tax=bioreactor metagenome TaxID=1076179 RepID=A0A644YRU1_9ZZZZ